MFPINQIAGIAGPGHTMCQDKIGSSKLLLIPKIDPGCLSGPSQYVVLLIARQFQVGGADYTQTILLSNPVPA